MKDKMKVSNISTPQKKHHKTHRSGIVPKENHFCSSMEDEEEDWTDTNWCSFSEQIHPHGMNLKSLMFSTSPKKMEGSTKARDQDKAISTTSLATDVKTSNSNEGVLSRMLLNDNKAGMEGLDKDKINQIILEASKGSKFFENERKKEEQVNKRIEEQQRKLQKITKEEIHQGEIEADKILEDLHEQRDLSRTIVHVDMDAFYAAVEMRDDPSLRNKPMAVGGNSMLSTSNYLARKYGVRAAMPGFIGKKLCPDLVMVSPNFEKYSAVSKEIRSVLAFYDPNYCPMSLDEAYLDITQHLEDRKHLGEVDRSFLVALRDPNCKDQCLCDVNETIREINKSSFLGLLNSTPLKNTQLMSSNCKVRAIEEKCLVNIGEVCSVCGKRMPKIELFTFDLSPEGTVHEMRVRIEQKTRLTASAGIAPNMMLAKVCSDKNKPNGQFRIRPTVDEVMNFIMDLPTRKISGIGKVSEKMLNALGVFTCRQLYDQRALLYHLYSSISFNYFMRICIGIGSSTVERGGERKSISTERTFNEMSKPEDLFEKCKELSDSLSEDLKSEKLSGKTVTLKVKTVNFDVKTRAQTLKIFTSDSDVIYSAAVELLKTEIKNAVPKPLKLRLMGVRMSNLKDEDTCRKEQQYSIKSFITKVSSNQQEGLQEPEHENTTGTCNEYDLNETQLQLADCSDPVISTQILPKCAIEDMFTGSSDKSNQVLSCSESMENNTIGSRRNSGGKIVSNCGQESLAKEMTDQVSNVCDEKTDKNKHSNVVDSHGISVKGDLKHSSELNLNQRGISNSAIEIQFKEKNLGITVENDAESMEDINGSSLEYACPVCCEYVNCHSLDQFNSHIDICLNKKIVMECSRYVPENDSTRKSLTNQKTPAKRTSKSSVSKSSGKQKNVKKLISNKTLVLKVENPDSGNGNFVQSRTDNSNSSSLTTKGTSTHTSPDTSGGHQNSSSSSVCEMDNANNNTMTDEHPSLLLCPVCFMEQKNSLDEFNAHVDTCLSKETISDIIKKQDKASVMEKHKRTPGSTAGPNAKRRKISGELSAKSSPSQIRPSNKSTILTFFKQTNI